MKITLVLLSCLLSVALSDVDKPTDGKYPYHVAIIRGDKVLCDGAIIHKRFVLTAAKCFYGGEVGNLVQEVQKGEVKLVVGGVANTEESHNNVTLFSTLVHEVSKIIVKPEYNPAQNTDNVLLLKVDKNLEDSGDNTVKPQVARLAIDTEEINYVGSPLGFFKNEGTSYAWKGQRLTQELVHKKLAISSNDNDCAGKNGYFSSAQDRKAERKEDSMYCVPYGKKNVDDDHCLSMYGAPLVYRTTKELWGDYEYTLVGVGAGCQAETADIFTRIPSVSEWIKSTITKNL